MSNLFKNIVVFTLVLILVTLSLEYFRKGSFEIENPLFFFGAVLVLGITGGYIVTWVYKHKDIHF